MSEHLAVFFDRDGVLNQSIIKNGKPYPPACLEELKISKDVAPALLALKQSGFLNIVVTNQPDVARGKTKRQTVELINNKLISTLALDDIYVCYHDDKDNCDCRKPKAGLLLKAAEKYGINLAKSYMIGDRWKDIEAGQNAGCYTVWINQGYLEDGPKQLPDYTTNSVAEAVNWILNRVLD